MGSKAPNVSRLESSIYLKQKEKAVDVLFIVVSIKKEGDFK